MTSYNHVEARTFCGFRVLRCVADRDGKPLPGPSERPRPGPAATPESVNRAHAYGRGRMATPNRTPLVP